MKNERLGDPDGRDQVSRPEGARRDAKDDEAKNENLDNDKTGAKDGQNNPDNYAGEDGEAMNETSPGHRTQGENDPDGGDGNDANGFTASAGMYIYSLHGGGISISSKMILIK